MTAIRICKGASTPTKAEVPGMLDMASEPPVTLDLYGLNDPVTDSFGKRFELDGPE